MLRAALLAIGVWWIYASSQVWVTVVVVTLAGGLMLDSFLVATAHATGVAGYPGHHVRFVALNLITFASLNLWFAIFLAPIYDHFRDTLDAVGALKFAFVATTSSAVIQAPEPVGRVATLAAAFITMVALYYLIVILTVATATWSIPEEREKARAATSFFRVWPEMFCPTCNDSQRISHSSAGTALDISCRSCGQTITTLRA